MCSTEIFPLRSPESQNSTIVTIFGVPMDSPSARTGLIARIHQLASPAAAPPVPIKNDRRAIRLGFSEFFLFAESIASPSSLSSECEGKSLYARIEKFNFKRPIFHFALLPDQLIQPVLLHNARALLVGVHAVILAGRGAIKPHAETHGLSIFPRS